MDVRQGFVDCVGRTPLIRLTKLSAETGCEILGKAEFMNPGGSVKDRAALYIIRDAERRGVLKPRHRGRGHGGQHRHWFRAYLRGARLSLRDRDSRHAIAGQAGDPAHARRRRAPGAGGALP